MEILGVVSIWRKSTCSSRAARNVPFDAENEDKLGLGRDVVAAILFAQTSETDLLAFCISVLLDVGFGTFEDDSTFFLPSLQMRVVSTKNI